jgi:predicted membrane metal-binding protein
MLFNIDCNTSCWWATWWFWLLVAFAALVAMLVLWVRLRILKQKAKLLQELADKRIEQFREAKNALVERKSQVQKLQEEIKELSEAVNAKTVEIKLLV